MEILLIGLVVMMLAFCVILVVTVFSYTRLYKKYYLLKAEQEDLRSDTEKNADKIIEDAQAQAREIIAKAELITSESKDEFENTLKTLSQKEASELELVMDNVKKETAEVLQNTLNSIRQEVAGDKIIAFVQNEMKKELSKRADKLVYEILNQVSKEVLKRTIDLKKHEELVFDALKRAKNENLL